MSDVALGVTDTAAAAALAWVAAFAEAALGEVTGAVTGGTTVGLAVAEAVVLAVGVPDKLVVDVVVGPDGPAEESALP